MTSVHAPPARSGAATRPSPSRSPPSSPRGASRLRLQVLLAVLGVYVLGFLVWGACYSRSLARVALPTPLHLHMFPVTGTGRADEADVTLDARLMRQLELRRGGGLGRAASAADGRPLDAPRNLRCLGWRGTEDCDPDGPVARNVSHSCDQFVRGGASGYCLMQDEDSGELVRLMLSSCLSLRSDVVFSCRYADDFAAFHAQVAALATHIQQQAANETSTSTSAKGSNLATAPLAGPASTAERKEGIVMVMYPSMLVSVYASIRALRATNCTLPVELWYLESEMHLDLDDSSGGSRNGSLGSIPTALQRDFGPVTLHAIADAAMTGFNSKVYAVLHTQLERVLFLDADNVAVRDPSFLLASHEFQATGAVFWPDFWHPQQTIFNIHGDSLLWELLGLPAVDMFEQESGQLLVDKPRCRGALRMLELLAFHEPNIFSRLKLAHGDKDLFRLAWLKTHSPFHMMASPPGVAGSVRGDKFCGMSMVQFAPDGSVLFLHRNAKKLTGGLTPQQQPDAEIWTHLQRFRYRAASPHAAEMETAFEARLPRLRPSERLGSPRVALGNLEMPYEVLRHKYRVQIFPGAPEFEDSQWCYGQASLTAPRFKTLAWQDAGFPRIEPELLQYAAEAVALLPPAARQVVAELQ